MEFNEKLQELRKSRGLTQEELAEALFVSRTAVSKWESGRGYPSIDSLKEISKYFSVTIDELLTGEKLISIAERENKSNIQRICDLLTGLVDLFSFILIVLPLYSNPINGYIYSVNLFDYTETTSFNRLLYWIMFLALVLVGTVKIFITQFELNKGQKIVTDISIVLSIMTILFLAMTREAYAITVAFFLFVVKGILLFKHIKSEK
ncbi:helix-turn-helix transcriptional regulator [uncultured Ruminococcus sp.]|uniref:helix-turn-helix domain-containing protein n=1 Tax=uncultured Ruminococcus sp. TaxID=165186 RepID=UPI002942DE3E|nr:helix-turn-helix transcriptional regulator [uncultured Ruminococcus sp.]